MQKLAFIIAEYNPLHNGHLYHIAQTKKAGAETIAVIMSGNFVQRGEPALFPKYERAAAALLSGADLVLEIPLKYTVCGSDCFSSASVTSAFITGLKATLSFGAAYSADMLITLSDFLSDKTNQHKINEMCVQTGCSYPKAQQTVAAQQLGEALAAPLNEPNSILAIQYIKHCRAINAPFDFCCIPRVSSQHDSLSVSDSFSASAMNIRRNIFNRDFDLHRYMPDFSAEIAERCLSTGKIISPEKYEIASLSRLQTLSKDELRNVNGVNQGLETPLFEAIRRCASLEKVYFGAKSKRYTLSRIRQICTAAVLGISRQDLENGISYVKVLGFNSKGKTLLKEIRQKSSVPFIGLLSQANKSETKIRRDVTIEEKAEELYNLCLQKPYEKFSPYCFKPIIMK